MISPLPARPSLRLFHHEHDTPAASLLPSSSASFLPSLSVHRRLQRVRRQRNSLRHYSSLVNRRYSG